MTEEERKCMYIYMYVLKDSNILLVFINISYELVFVLSRCDGIMDNPTWLCIFPC